MNGKTIYFDLDGTVYDLYAQPDWLARITTDKDATVYGNVDAVMHDMAALMEVLIDLVHAGWTIGVISWLPAAGRYYEKNPLQPTREFKNAVRSVKKVWVRRFLPMATEIHIVQCGTPKHQVALDRDGILVDDNAEVREAWGDRVIDPADNLIEQLRGLLQ